MVEQGTLSPVIARINRGLGAFLSLDLVILYLYMKIYDS